MKISRFEDLECWQESRILVRKIYEVTKIGDFKKDLRFSGQIQAAAISAMANIAEGFERRSDKEFVQFLYIAMASTAEVKSHL
jgi:four helix bundle protein